MHTHTPHPYCIGVQAGRQASRLTEIVSEFYMDGVYPIDHDNAYRIRTYENNKLCVECWNFTVDSHFGVSYCCMVFCQSFCTQNAYDTHTRSNDKKLGIVIK